MMIKALLGAALLNVVLAQYGDYGGGYDVGGYGGAGKGYGYGHKKKGLNEWEAKEIFTDKIWKGLESYVKPYQPWPGQFKTKLEGKTFYAKAKPVFIDRPPIIKIVKQPVIIRQPVVVKKVPIITKEKTVTIKKQPPQFEINKNVDVKVKDFEHAAKKPIKPVVPPVDGGYGTEGKAKGYEEGGDYEGLGKIRQ